MSASVFGDLDVPVHGGHVRSPAIEVSGWAVFPGSRVDHVDIFLDGVRVTGALHSLPRPDLVGGLPCSEVEALTAGFRAIVGLPEADQESVHTVQVLAAAIDGRTWCSSQIELIVHATTSGDEPPSLDLGPLECVTKPPESGGPRRICVFTHSLNLAGGELYLQDLLLGLKSTRDIEILVVAPSSGPLKEELEKANISVHITAGYHVDSDYYAGRVVELGALARVWGADLAIVNTLGMFAGAEAALSAGIPVLWAIHESFTLPVFSYLNWQGELSQWVRERWHDVLRRSELIYEADATRELHQSELPGLSARVIRYGVDLARIADYEDAHDRATIRRELGFQPTDRVLLCMAVIQERKAQLQILLAFASIAHHYPDAKLVFVGDHPASYPAQLKACIDALGIRDRVEVAPIAPDTFKWYHGADVLISASEIESLPRSMMEAHAFGLPVLAADVFGVQEVVADGETGWLFTPSASSSMVAAMIRILDLADSELAQFAARARAASTAYDHMGYVHEYAQLIDELCARS